MRLGLILAVLSGLGTLPSTRANHEPEVIARHEICQVVHAEYSDYYQLGRCLMEELEDHGRFFRMVFVFCGEWNQYVAFDYINETGEVLESSFGDTTEDCESR